MAGEEHGPLWSKPRHAIRQVRLHKKLSGNQLIKVRDHEYCLKEESEMFENPPEKQEFRENNPLPLTIALLAAGLVLIIGIPILIVILVKRHKKKKAKQA